MLNAILGELIQTKGDRTINGSVAFAAQTAWILNRTLQENVVFGIKSAYAYWWAVHGSQTKTHEWLWSVSKELRTEVLLEVNKSLLEKVPLFATASEQFLVAVTEALRTELYLPGGYAILFGEIGHEM